MTKLRSNHVRSSKQSSGMITKVGIFGLILGALYFAFEKFSGFGGEAAEEVVFEDVENLEEAPNDEIFYFPTSTTGEVIKHQYYALSYSERHEQPEWVAYELTRDRLNQEWVRRTNDFREDPKISNGSATLGDYRRSGYDRGHLVPAADMAFNEQAMSETFYLSNMCPQTGSFNKGVWRELEELTRDWAKKFRHLYVVSGPVLTQPIKYWIGENQVAVPTAFYKVLLDLSDPELKGIGFLIPNDMSEEPIHTYATSIDVIEEATGINFFPDLMEPILEKEIEKEYDPKLWHTNSKKYQLRVDKWNKQ